MVGLSLLVGGWRHPEQRFNVLGANTYLGVIIPLTVFSLILPNYRVTKAGPTRCWRHFGPPRRSAAA
jgi:Ca2+:H+ antiporter